MKNSISILLLLSFFYYKGTAQTPFFGKKALNYKHFSYKVTGYFSAYNSNKERRYFPKELEIYADCTTPDSLLCDYVIKENGAFREAYFNGEMYKYNRDIHKIYRSKVYEHGEKDIDRPNESRFALKSKQIIRPSKWNLSKHTVSEITKGDTVMLSLSRKVIDPFAQNRDSVDVNIEWTYTLSDSMLHKFVSIENYVFGPDTNYYVFSDWKHYGNRVLFDSIARQALNSWKDSLRYVDTNPDKYLKAMKFEGVDFEALPLLDSQNDTSYIKDIKSRFVILNFGFKGCHHCALLAKDWDSNLDYLKDLDTEMIYVDFFQKYRDKPDIHTHKAYRDIPNRYLGRKYPFFDNIVGPTMVVYDMKEHKISKVLAGYKDDQVTNILQHLASMKIN
jgi:thioredoxin-related protein